MNDLVPEPEQPNSETSGRKGGNKSRSAHSGPTPPPIPNERDCLRALTQIGALVTTGILTPAQANAIRQAYTEILKYHQRQQSGPSPTTVDQKGLAKMLSEHPEWGAMLEPLLSKEQIESLLRGGEDTDGAEPS